MAFHPSIVIKPNHVEGIGSQQLRSRAERAHGGRSIEFVAYAGHSEVGYLSYEDWTDQRSGFVFELFVLPEYRGAGAGSLLLSYAENYAVQRSCSSIRLKPYALAEGMNQDQLEAWYKRKGYSSCVEQPEHLEKFLSPPNAA